MTSTPMPHSRYYEYDHLPDHLQPVSRIIHRARAELLALPDCQDPNEFAEGMRELLRAKDCFVRSFVPFRPDEQL